jgi:hypothetical protein
MLYRLVYHVLHFFKRFPQIIPLSLAALVLSAFGGIIGAKIYQELDWDSDRGGKAIQGGAFGESYSIPRYLEQGWRPQDSLWFYNTSQGSGLMPYDFFIVLEVADSKSRESCSGPTRTSTASATSRRRPHTSIPIPCRSAS